MKRRSKSIQRRQLLIQPETRRYSPTLTRSASYFPSFGASKSSPPRLVTMASSPPARPTSLPPTPVKTVQCHINARIQRTLSLIPTTRAPFVGPPASGRPCGPRQATLTRDQSSALGPYPTKRTTGPAESTSARSRSRVPRKSGKDQIWFGPC
jgi:hypothetical protein